MCIRDRPEPTPKPKPVYQKLASYTSPMTSEDKNRIYNRKLAAKKRQEHVIDPGETMSFNKVVGDTNQPQGYTKACLLYTSIKPCYISFL